MPPPQPTSLVKYDNPVLVSEARKKGKIPGAAGGRKKGAAGNKLPPVGAEGGAAAATTVAGGGGGKAAGGVAANPAAGAGGVGVSSSGSSLSQTEDILNSILPPVEWLEAEQPWIQYVSSTPATRLDVINLQEQLDQKLQQRQARETGICPVREELYGQCFDELIRQVTINCAERGLLLLRVRDEIRMTIAAYKTLYESSVAYGIRKALHAEQGKADMLATIRQLEREKADLQRQVLELNSKCEAIEKHEIERRQADERKHQEEVNFLRKANQQLTTQLQTLLGTNKK